MSPFPWEYPPLQGPRKELSGLMFVREQRLRGAEPPDPVGRPGTHRGLLSWPQTHGRPWGGNSDRGRSPAQKETHGGHIPNAKGLPCSSSCQENLNVCKGARLSPKGLSCHGGARWLFVSCGSGSTRRARQIRPRETRRLPRAGLWLLLTGKSPKSPG